ncbi:MAG: ADP-glyceromanno-heptose 6-epimerase [Verrucomicrobia bacterium]|nr:ADP-glyceromanno-heptose 6-epimerase [Verrucomicrobiota bacterium]
MSALDGRILVTGGAGFIGSALVWALNRRGLTNIVVADFLDPRATWRASVPLTHNAPAKEKNLRPLKFAEFVEADALRTRLRADAGAFGKFSAVFHLGANSSTTEKNEALLRDINFEHTRELAGWSLAQGARYVYASSAATYGDGSAGMDDRDDNLARLHPLNLYGQSKQDFDVFAQREGWLPRIVGVKYFNVFGPNEDHKGDMRSLVNKAYQQILATGRVQLFKSRRPEFKDGEQMRDFLYVKDAIEMTLHFAEHPTGLRAGGLYNLGSGEANTWLTLTRAIFAALGREPQIDFIDMPEVLRGKYQYYTKADTGKLRDTGYVRPMTPLTDAVRDYVQNYLVPAKKLGE